MIEGLSSMTEELDMGMIEDRTGNEEQKEENNFSGFNEKEVETSVKITEMRRILLECRTTMNTSLIRRKKLQEEIWQCRERRRMDSMNLDNTDEMAFIPVDPVTNQPIIIISTPRGLRSQGKALELPNVQETTLEYKLKKLKPVSYTHLTLPTNREV